jgi:hypothetical protein
MTAATVRLRAALTVAAPAEYLTSHSPLGHQRQLTLLARREPQRNGRLVDSLPAAPVGPGCPLTFSAGGVEGGYAQVDDVELICGPGIFTDGFESGLTTHWSAGQN